jgi:hypothetical protein
VLGPSGAGKSSVVLAGLLPALKSGALPGSDHWRYLTVKTGARPLDALAVALAKQTSADVVAIRDSLSRNERALLLYADLLAGQDRTRIVLIVDQFEELWTQAPAESEAHAAFVEHEQRRSARCSSSSQCVRAGGLPLLEYTLLELWEMRCPDGTMTWEAYHSLGGVKGAISARADAILEANYTLAQQNDLRHILAAQETARRERLALLEARTASDRRNLSRLGIFLAVSSLLIVLALVSARNASQSANDYDAIRTLPSSGSP